MAVMHSILATGILAKLYILNIIFFSVPSNIVLWFSRLEWLNRQQLWAWRPHKISSSEDKRQLLLYYRIPNRNCEYQFTLILARKWLRAQQFPKLLWKKTNRSLLAVDFSEWASFHSCLYWSVLPNMCLVKVILSLWRLQINDWYVYW